MSALKSKRLRARIGGLSLAAQRNPTEYTAAGRAAFMRRFERQVDPEGILPEAERQRRAEAAKKAYFSQLALKSAEARRGRKKKSLTRGPSSEKSQKKAPLNQWRG